MNLSMRHVTPLALVAVVGAACVVLASQQNTAQTQRIPQFENDHVKVWKSIVAPNSPVPLHRHDHPRIITALVGGTMKIVEQDGSSEVHVWETGKSYWLSANAPGSMHTDVNNGNKPIEVMVVELKKAN
jgi:beta-alanine degradation protein BauB